MTIIRYVKRSPGSGRLLGLLLVYIITVNNFITFIVTTLFMIINHPGSSDFLALVASSEVSPVVSPRRVSVLDEVFSSSQISHHPQHHHCHHHYHHHHHYYYDQYSRSSPLLPAFLSGLVAHLFSRTPNTPGPSLPWRRDVQSEPE